MGSPFQRWLRVVLQDPDMDRQQLLDVAWRALGHLEETEGREELELALMHDLNGSEPLPSDPTPIPFRIPRRDGPDL